MDANEARKIVNARSKARSKEKASFRGQVKSSPVEHHKEKPAPDERLKLLEEAETAIRKRAEEGWHSVQVHLGGYRDWHYKPVAEYLRQRGFHVYVGHISSPSGRVGQGADSLSFNPSLDISWYEDD